MESVDLSKYKNVILRIVVLAVALLISRSVYNNHTLKLEALKAQRETEIKRSGALVEIAQLEKKVEAYKKLLAYRGEDYVIAIITNIARETGVKVVSIRPVPERTVSYERMPYKNIAFDLVLSATNYHLIGNFVSRMESFKETVLQVENTKIAPDIRSKELTVNLTVNNIIFVD